MATWSSVSTTMYQHEWSTVFGIDVDAAVDSNQNASSTPGFYMSHTMVSETGNTSSLSSGLGSGYDINTDQLSQNDYLMVHSSQYMPNDYRPENIQAIRLPIPSKSNQDATNYHYGREYVADSMRLDTTPVLPRRVASPHYLPEEAIVESKQTISVSSGSPAAPRMELACRKNIEKHVNYSTDDVPPRISKDCPDEERFLLECRWEQRNDGGQIWEDIQRKYREKFKRTVSKASLQMKYKRGKVKYIIWLPKDEEILRKAWEAMERDRYKNLLAMFFESGGSRNMLLSPSDVEHKVSTQMDLGEEINLNGASNLTLRRRYRHSRPKRHNLMPRGSAIPQEYDDEAGLLSGPTILSAPTTWNP